MDMKSNFHKIFSGLHVLFIPASYPTTYNPVRAIFFKDQAEALADRGVKTGVLAIVHLAWEIFRQKKIDFGFRCFVEHGVNVIHFQTPALPWNKFLYNDFKYIIGQWLFSKYVRKFGLPDIIHLQTFLPGDLGLWIKAKFGIPFVVTEHFSYFQDGMLRPWQDKLAKRLFHNSSANFAVSHNTATFLQRRYACAVKYIPNMVDTNFFKPDFSRVSSPENRIFITLGSLDANKNHSMLIRAFKQAFSEKKFSDFKLYIIGEGPLRKNLFQLIQSENLTQRVQFLGHLSREEVRSNLQKSDYFVLSSRVETFGVALIEAMSCGLPVLSTRCGGPESIITDNSVGLLCDNKEESLVVGLKNLASSSFNRSYIRNFVVKNFSKEVVSSELIREYQKVLGMS
jgi:L-malate glycosyltransferase